jgi:hypothetical protein
MLLHDAHGLNKTMHASSKQWATHQTFKPALVSVHCRTLSNWRRTQLIPIPTLATNAVMSAPLSLKLMVDIKLK